MNERDLQLVQYIAETRSISNGARLLHMTVATASAALKRLEKELGALLFVRSTRGLKLSEAGERFLFHGQSALQHLAMAREAVNPDSGSISGNLNISAASDLGRNLLVPWLDQFMAEHPDLSVQLFLSDTLSDFYQERVDIALRYGQLNDSNLVATTIAQFNYVVCASPGYIAQHGAPTHPNDLGSHNCLCYMLYGLPHDLWRFQDNGVEFKVIPVPLSICSLSGN